MLTDEQLQAIEARAVGTHLYYSVAQLVAEVRRLSELLMQAHAVQGDLENQLEGLRQQQRQQLHDEQEGET